MTDQIVEFFDGISRRGHEPGLERITGSVRFDLFSGEQVDHWLLQIKEGDLTVSRGMADAECVIHADRSFFEQIVMGRDKPLAAMIRNDIMVEGNLRLFFTVDRLLPGPPGARDPRAVAAERRHP